MYRKLFHGYFVYFAIISQKTVDLINNFKNYFTANHQTIYENPSPGNKAGGISTLEDKSNGCVQKSGSAAVSDVLEYGDRLVRNGLNLLSTPGNDLVAATAEAAAGCQMVLFTTGRGTPFATAVPTIKIATNSRLANAKKKIFLYDQSKLGKQFLFKVCSQDELTAVITDLE